MHSKKLEDMSFEEIVTECSGEVLESILGGTPLRKAVWRACELAVRWRTVKDDKERKNNEG